MAALFASHTPLDKEDNRLSSLFAELDYQVTPLGTLMLRRRRDLATGDDIYEIKLNDEFLMSSKFTVS